MPGHFFAFRKLLLGVLNTLANKIDLCVEVTNLPAKAFTLGRQLGIVFSGGVCLFFRCAGFRQLFF